MNYKIVNGSISYGAETILEEINFEIKEKDKIAIIGRNGAGKTTFLRAIIDNTILEEGIGQEKFQIYKQGSPIMGYLKQMSFENSDKTMLEEILEVYEPILKLEKRIQEKEKALQIKTDERLIKEYTNALEQYEIQGGYVYKKEYEIAIKKFGFREEDKHKKISAFSGGQKNKIAFLKLLLSKPDILLLDEPTNHLDIVAIEWLENYLKNYPKAVVIVSHDRMFLDKIVNKVYEIEYASMVEYIGNYTEFEKQKRENYQKQQKDYEYQQAEIKRLQAIADRFRYKPTKAKMALSKLKKIEQMTIIDKPQQYDLKTFYANFDVKVQSGKMVLKVDKLEIGYDKPITEVSFELYKGQKLAIIGENGTGKSTLLKTLNGNIPKIKGEFEYGYHVQKGYFDQQMEFLNQENTIFEEIVQEFPELTTTQARTLLGTFLFTGEDVFKKIKVLSGGEKGRLQLCKILRKQPNVLLLDEPTNHMDILGKESLENILKEYTGTLIFVSHDRYFVNKLADCILEFENGNVTFYNKNYQEYIEDKENNERVNDQQNEIKDSVNKNKNGNMKINNIKDRKKENNTYFIEKERNRIKNKMKKIEMEIEEKEKEIQEIEKQMLKEEICSDYIKLGELQEEIQKKNQEIEKKMQEWEFLNEEL